MAPVDTKSEKCLNALFDYASDFVAATAESDSQWGTTSVPANIWVPNGVPRSPHMIARLEEWHKVVISCTVGAQVNVLFIRLAMPVGCRFVSVVVVAIPCPFSRRIHCKSND